MPTPRPSSRRTRGRILLAVALAAGVVFATLPAGAQSTRDRLNAQRQRVTRLKAEYERIAAAYAQTEKELQDTRTRMTRTKADISRAEGDMAQLRQQLKDRVRAAYRMRGVGFFHFLLEARSFRDFNLRMMSLQRQTLDDEDLILKLRKKRHELETRQAELDRQAGVLADQKAAYESQGRKLTISFEQARRLQQQLADQLSREEIARLFRVSRGSSRGGGGGVVIPLDYCPVQGPHVFSNDWGAPRGGGTRRHKGNDLMAPHGAPIVATVAGRVTRTGNGGLGGKTVYLWGNGVEFYYAHLSSIDVSAGQTVSAGQRLGANGDSGNARGGPPHLHFEIHPGGGGAVNPYPSLIRVC